MQQKFLTKGFSSRPQSGGVLLASLHVVQIPNLFHLVLLLCLPWPFLSALISCPPQVRSTISDFAVFLTIVIMVVIDFLIGIPSPKLHVPHMFKVMGSFGTGLASPHACASGNITLVVMGLDRAESVEGAGGVTFSSSTFKCIISPWKHENDPKT